jgi:hypothetical protein
LWARSCDCLIALTLRVAGSTELTGDLVGLLDHTTEFVIWDTFAGAHTNRPCDEFEERLGTQEAGHKKQSPGGCQDANRARQKTGKAKTGGDTRRCETAETFDWRLGYSIGELSQRIETVGSLFTEHFIEGATSVCIQRRL